MKMNRRELLKNSLLTVTALAGSSVLANDKINNCSNKKTTPKQPEGPFYPIVDQVDTDADLIYVANLDENNPRQSQIARGRVIIIEGTVTDLNCKPVEGALVEIWQACETGKYNHPSDPNPAELDPNFQYWGKATTDQNGFYRFRTIIPGAYPADVDWIRPPHIHFKVSKLGYLELITQLYFAGEVLNSQDKILSRLSAKQQQEVTTELKQVPNVNYPVGTFNIKIEKI